MHDVHLASKLLLGSIPQNSKTNSIKVKSIYNCSLHHVMGTKVCSTCPKLLSKINKTLLGLFFNDTSYTTRMTSWVVGDAKLEIDKLMINW